MTRALILAAGQGTRLRPLTDDSPKCLVHFNGESLLERQARTLKAAGIQDIQVATGYKAENISKLGFETHYNPLFASTNMVESLFSARAYIEEAGDLIISYGDIIYEQANLNVLLNADDEIALMIDANWKALWSLRFDDPLADAETLVKNDHGYITELGKKTQNYDDIQGQYTGLIKIRADKLNAFLAFYDGLDREATYDGRAFEQMYMTTLIQLLIAAKWQVKAVMVQGGWLEVDSVTDLECYESMNKQGSLDSFFSV
jgi:L-glutamine-phosphate cytidylyltransferase